MFNKTRKKVECLLLSTILIIGSFVGLLYPKAAEASYETYHNVTEIESNDTMDDAQFIDVKPSYFGTDENIYFYQGTISSQDDVDWIKIAVNERGFVRVDKTQGFPNTTFIEKNKDGSDGDGIIEKGDVMFIKITDSTRADYTLKIQMQANPIGNNPHEPNDVFNQGTNQYEYAVIPSNQLVDTNWSSKYDFIDNFAIMATNQGTLSFEVHYPDDEYQYWQKYDKDYYISYNLYAEKKDGTFKHIFGDAVIGMPNQIYRRSIQVNNDNYTGKYVLSLMNSQIIDLNYKIKMNFENAQTTGETPQPGGEGQSSLKDKVTRLAGWDRYSTARQFSSQLNNQSLDTVILASGNNFPDALAGGVLNKSLNGTILLVNDNNSIISEVLKETRRLLKPAGKVILLGGVRAVSQKVEDTFKKSFNVQRVGGSDRISTSIEIAKLTNANPSEAFLAYGFNFADALSIVSYASKINSPILLNDTQELNGKVKQYLQSKGISKVTIIGGEKVISNNIVNQLKGLGITVERVYGVNRYQTALTIANKYFHNVSSVALANGLSYPDALSGSRFALDQNMPILLSEPETLNLDVRNYLSKQNKIYFYGGEKAISSNLLN